MELSLRLDTLGMLEVRYLRGRERYRDWPPFLLLAASRQARVLAYLNREAVEELHQQILAVEEAAGLTADTETDDENEDNEADESEEIAHKEKDSENAGGLSPAFAQALEKLNDLARQRLPDGGGSIANPVSEELSALRDAALSGVDDDDEDALEQLQDAFVQMMEVVRELAEELSTDALKLTGRLRCARTEVFFTQAETSVEEDEDDAEDVDVEAEDTDVESGQITLALVLRLYEEGHIRPDDLPAVELQLDVDDFERLHETLDLALERERRSRRRH
ncbi:MAG TPA: hypothetical protein VH164_03245 [Ktedonobacteraceae bacterium]|jgi:hypothetical protein|nr:hypothetical protein [Ktedonobacteraceae bacterium]